MRYRFLLSTAAILTLIGVVSPVNSDNSLPKQTVKGAGLPILFIGDQIEFRLSYSTTMLKPKLGAKAKLIFSDGSVLTLKPLSPFAPTSGYTLATSGPQTLTRADVARVRSTSRTPARRDRCWSMKSTST